MDCSFLYVILKSIYSCNESAWREAVLFISSWFLTAQKQVGQDQYGIFGADAVTDILRVVLIPMPVSENAFKAAKNAGIGKYTSLCTNPIPCDLLAAQLYLASSQLAQLV